MAISKKGFIDSLLVAITIALLLSAGLFAIKGSSLTGHATLASPSDEPPLLFLAEPVNVTVGEPVVFTVFPDNARSSVTVRDDEGNIRVVSDKAVFDVQGVYVIDALVYLGERRERFSQTVTVIAADDSGKETTSEEMIAGEALLPNGTLPPADQSDASTAPEDAIGEHTVPFAWIPLESLPPMPANPDENAPAPEDPEGEQDTQDGVDTRLSSAHGERSAGTQHPTTALLAAGGQNFGFFADKTQVSVGETVAFFVVPGSADASVTLTDPTGSIRTLDALEATLDQPGMYEASALIYDGTRTERIRVQIRAGDMPEDVADSADASGPSAGPSADPAPLLDAGLTDAIVSAKNILAKKRNISARLAENNLTQDETPPNSRIIALPIERPGASQDSSDLGVPNQSSTPEAASSPSSNESQNKTSSSSSSSSSPDSPGITSSDTPISTSVFSQGQCGGVLDNGDSITLTDNVPSAGACNTTGITISARGAFLDCDGFNITGNSSIGLADGGTGLVINSSGNVTVRNCNIYNFTNGIVMNATGVQLGNITFDSINISNISIGITANLQQGTGYDNVSLSNMTIAGTAGTCISYNAGVGRVTNSNFTGINCMGDFDIASDSIFIGNVTIQNGSLNPNSGASNNQFTSIHIIGSGYENNGIEVDAGSSNTFGNITIRHMFDGINIGTGGHNGSSFVNITMHDINRSGIFLDSLNARIANLSFTNITIINTSTQSGSIGSGIAFNGGRANNTTFIRINVSHANDNIILISGRNHTLLDTVIFNATETLTDCIVINSAAQNITVDNVTLSLCQRGMLIQGDNVSVSNLRSFSADTAAVLVSTGADNVSFINLTSNDDSGFLTSGTIGNVRVFNAVFNDTFADGSDDAIRSASSAGTIFFENTTFTGGISIDATLGSSPMVFNYTNFSAPDMSIIVLYVNMTGGGFYELSNGSTFMVSRNLVGIDVSTATDWNVSANITRYSANCTNFVLLYDQTFQTAAEDMEDDPAVASFRNASSGVSCASPGSCVDLSCNSATNILTFNVTNWSSYRIHEQPVCGNLVDTSARIYTDINLTEGSTCLTINNDLVQLNCSGFAIRGNGSVTDSIGVLAAGRDNVNLTRCMITGFTTDVNFTNMNNTLIVDVNVSNATVGFNLSNMSSLRMIDVHARNISNYSVVARNISLSNFSGLHSTNTTIDMFSLTGSRHVHVELMNTTDDSQGTSTTFGVEIQAVTDVNITSGTHLGGSGILRVRDASLVRLLNSTFRNAVENAMVNFDNANTSIIRGINASNGSSDGLAVTGQNVSVENSFFESNSRYGLYILSSNNTTAVNVSVSDGGDASINIEASRNTTLRNSTSSYGFGIQEGGSSNTTLRNVLIEHSGVTGLGVGVNTPSDDGDFRDITVTNATSFGVRITNGDRHFFRNLTVSSSTIGFDFGLDGNHTLTDSVFFHISQNAIDFGRFSQNSTVIGVNISNATTGIVLASPDHRVYRVNITNVTIGINASSSSASRLVFSNLTITSASSNGTMFIDANASFMNDTIIRDSVGDGITLSDLVSDFTFVNINISNVSNGVVLQGGIKDFLRSENHSFYRMRFEDIIGDAVRILTRAVEVSIDDANFTDVGTAIKEDSSSIVSFEGVFASLNATNIRISNSTVGFNLSGSLGNISFATLDNVTSHILMGGSGASANFSNLTIIGQTAIDVNQGSGDAIFHDVNFSKENASVIFSRFNFTAGTENVVNETSFRIDGNASEYVIAFNRSAAPGMNATANVTMPFSCDAFAIFYNNSYDTNINSLNKTHFVASQSTAQGGDCLGDATCEDVRCVGGILNFDMLNWSSLGIQSAALRPNMTIIKADSADPATTGDALNYSINVTNFGNATAFNITIVENYSINVTFLGADPAPNSSNDTWIVHTIGINSSYIINVSVEITNVPLNNTNISNRINVTNYTNNTLGLFTDAANDTEDTVVVLSEGSFSANVSIAKFDSPDPVDQYSVLNYSLNISNSGNTTAFNITVVETFPAAVTFIDASVVANDSSNTTWIIHELDNASSVIINISVNVTECVASITNAVNITNYTNLSASAFPSPSNDTEATGVIQNAVCSPAPPAGDGGGGGGSPASPPGPPSAEPAFALPGEETAPAVAPGEEPAAEEAAPAEEAPAEAAAAEVSMPSTAPSGAPARLAPPGAHMTVLEISREDIAFFRDNEQIGTVSFPAGEDITFDVRVRNPQETSLEAVYLGATTPEGVTVVSVSPEHIDAIGSGGEAFFQMTLRAADAQQGASFALILESAEGIQLVGFIADITAAAPSEQKPSIPIAPLSAPLFVLSLPLLLLLARLLGLNDRLKDLFKNIIGLLYKTTIADEEGLRAAIARNLHRQYWRIKVTHEVYSKYHRSVRNISSIFIYPGDKKKIRDISHTYKVDIEHAALLLFAQRVNNGRMLAVREVHPAIKDDFRNISFENPLEIDTEKKQGMLKRIFMPALPDAATQGTRQEATRGAGRAMPPLPHAAQAPPPAAKRAPLLPRLLAPLMPAITSAKAIAGGVFRRLAAKRYGRESRASPMPSSRPKPKPKTAFVSTGILQNMLQWHPRWRCLFGPRQHDILVPSLPKMPKLPKIPRKALRRTARLHEDWFRRLAMKQKQAMPGLSRIASSRQKTSLERIKEDLARRLPSASTPPVRPGKSARPRASPSVLDKVWHDLQDASQGRSLRTHRAYLRRLPERSENESQRRRHLLGAAGKKAHPPPFVSVLERIRHDMSRATEPTGRMLADEVLACAKRGMEPVRIIAALKSKGHGDEEIDSAIARFNKDMDFIESWAEQEIGLGRSRPQIEQGLLAQGMSMDLIQYNWQQRARMPRRKA